MSKRMMVLVAVALLAVILTVYYMHVRITPQQLRVRIEQELPRGSSSSKVLLFLDSLKSEHSNLVAYHDSKFPASTQEIAAAIRGFRKGDLFADGVFMVFYFDEKDRLVGYTVDYGYTWW